MNILHLTALSLLSLLVATPALAQLPASKTDNGVTVECAISGSHKDGWSISGKNSEAKKKICTVNCELTQKTGGTLNVHAKAQTVKEAPLTTQMAGEVVSGKSFTVAKIISAACKNAS